MKETHKAILTICANNEVMGVEDDADLFGKMASDIEDVLMTADGLDYEIKTSAAFSNYNGGRFYRDAGLIGIATCHVDIEKMTATITFDEDGDEEDRDEEKEYLDEIPENWRDAFEKIETIYSEYCEKITR